MTASVGCWPANSLSGMITNDQAIALVQEILKRHPGPEGRALVPDQV